MILSVDQIATFYGESHILFSVSLRVNNGELVCLLGRNGAGKTTCIKSIMGLTVPRSGSIKFKDEEVIGLPVHKIAQLGIGYVPEDRRIFTDLTVLENLKMGIRGRKEAIIWSFQHIFEIFPVLERYQRRKGGTLSGGEQQMLTIARTLIGNPELLLLDEPMEGLAPLVIQSLEKQILMLKGQGLSMLISEQNIRSAMKFGDYSYIIEKGEIRYEGDTKELQRSADIMHKYLAV